MMIKILAIDDTYDNLVTLAGWLSYTFPDAQIITTLSGREGIEHALFEHPDLILLDLVMPIMDGIETCKKLKENQLSKHIPVIMLTSFKTDSEIRTKAYQAGVQAFLSKPIEKEELVAQVSSIIQNKNVENYFQLENDLFKEKLRIRTQKFEEELKKTMAANLAEAAKYMEDSKLFKSAFLSNISHEIRTPLNGILGFSELLKEPKLTGDEQQEYIQIIERSGLRMLNIINNIVLISNIESGQCGVYISELNLNEQVESLYQYFKSEVEEKGLRFSFKHVLPSNEAKIKTDPDKLVSILTNLIKNAIQYTIEGSIEFGCKIEYTTQEPYIQFFVQDTGIGVSKDRQEAIFECFVQADIANGMANQGAGLGLAISKAYVEMLGGNIWVESDQDSDKHGSCFYFTIPLSGGKLPLKTNANVNFKTFSE
ncbi:MAG: hybrid sensor histidine kinase/response regulator [Bacteroidales bacterium]|nr:hybrid sensor histidine kinase/response regulator [Bacteroidales bacterium]